MHPKRLWSRLVRHHLFWSVAALALLLLFNLVFMPWFFYLELKDGHLSGELIDMLRWGAPLLLLALGMTPVVATGGVDLSVGAIMAITAGITFMLTYPLANAELYGQRVEAMLHAQGVIIFPVWFAILLALPAAILCGVWNGLLVSRVKISPVVATLVLMVAGRGIAGLITPIIMGAPGYPVSYLFIGHGYVLGLPVSFFIVAMVFGVIWLLTNKTALGLFLRAVGSNERASSFSGINVKNVKLLAYTCCGFCAGVGGLIDSSNIRFADANTIGYLAELDAIMAVVIGGTALGGGHFSLVGSLVGALIILILDMTIYYIGLPANAGLCMKAVVLLLIVILGSTRVKAWVDKRMKDEG